jgi:hypothetical protein
MSETCVTSRSALTVLAVHFSWFRVTGIGFADDRTRIDVSANSHSTKCLDCGGTSTSVDSSYARRLRDLPVLGKPVEVTVSVRRFRCRASGCSRVTFVESLDWLALRYAQRTQRVTTVLRSLVSLLSSTLGRSSPSRSEFVPVPAHFCEPLTAPFL